MARYLQKWERTQKEILDEAFEICDAVHSWSIAEMARQASLSPSCISNLYYGQTKRPQFRTVLLVCRAVGMDLQAIKLQIKKVAA